MNILEEIDDYDTVLYTYIGKMDGGRTAYVKIYFNCDPNKTPSKLTFGGNSYSVYENTSTSYPTTHYVQIYKNGVSTTPSYPAIGTKLNITYA